MEQPVFKTENLELGAFLMAQGIRYLDSSVEFDQSKRRPKVTMRFADDRQNALDLERAFITSAEKRFCESRKYLLKEVHKSMRRFSEQLINEQEEEG